MFFTLSMEKAIDQSKEQKNRDMERLQLMSCGQIYQPPHSSIEAKLKHSDDTFAFDRTTPYDVLCNLGFLKEISQNYSINRLKEMSSPVQLGAVLVKKLFQIKKLISKRIYLCFMS